MDTQTPTIKSMTIGFDPDSVAHGMAVYRDGVLVELRSMTLMEVHVYLYQLSDEERDVLEIGIENVLASNFVYTRNAKSNKAAHAKVALSVGRCQQAQYDLMQVLEYHGLNYCLINPGGNNWADDPALFQRITGWIGRSNHDTRSAAFFGYLVLPNDMRG